MQIIINKVTKSNELHPLSVSLDIKTFCDNKETAHVNRLLVDYESLLQASARDRRNLFMCTTTIEKSS